MESCSEKKTRPDWTTDTYLLASPGPGGEQPAGALWFLEEKVVSEQEEEKHWSSSILSSFISSLEDREWQIIQDRMVEAVSNSDPN